MEGRKPVALLIAALALIFGGLTVFSLHLANRGDQSAAVAKPVQLTAEQKKAILQSLLANQDKSKDRSTQAPALTAAQKKAVLASVLVPPAGPTKSKTASSLTAEQKKAILGSLQKNN